MTPPTLRTGKLCYPEIPALDVHESATFYERAFGWTIDPAGNLLGIYQQPGLAEAEGT
jgi:uncharacterized protein